MCIKCWKLRNEVESHHPLTKAAELRVIKGSLLKIHTYIWFLMDPVKSEIMTDTMFFQELMDVGYTSSTAPIGRTSDTTEQNVINEHAQLLEPYESAISQRAIVMLARFKLFKLTRRYVQLASQPCHCPQIISRSSQTNVSPCGLKEPVEWGMWC